MRDLCRGKAREMCVAWICSSEHGDRCKSQGVINLPEFFLLILKMLWRRVSDVVFFELPKYIQKNNSPAQSKLKEFFWVQGPPPPRPAREDWGGWTPTSLGGGSDRPCPSVAIKPTTTHQEPWSSGSLALFFERNVEPEVVHGINVPLLLLCVRRWGGSDGAEALNAGSARGANAGNVALCLDKLKAKENPNKTNVTTTTN